MDYNSDYEKLLSTADRFVRDGKYDSAADIYNEIMKEEPLSEDVWFGYIRALTWDFQKRSPSKVHINEISGLKDELLSCAGDDKKDYYESVIGGYLDTSYDLLQSRLEEIDAHMSKQHSKQVALEQISKKKYIEERQNKKTRRIIVIGLLVLFSLVVLCSLIFGTVTLISLVRSNGGFYFVLLKDLLVIISLLLTAVFTVVILASVFSLKKVDREIKQIDADYEKETQERAERFSLEYEKYQNEYQELTKES